jgi:hypothetical protein
VCGLEIERTKGGGEGEELRVRHPSGGTRALSVATVVERMDKIREGWDRSGVQTGPGGPRPRLPATAHVRMRSAGPEGPVLHEDFLLGFVERFGRGVRGLLRLTEAHLELHPTGEPSKTLHWPLEAITALQTSSSSVQITLEGEGLFQFRFEEASPKRWDDLLRWALQERWRALGRGDIAEFQPRIRGARPR